MKRGSSANASSQASKRARRPKKGKRDRIILFALLVLIGALLVVLLTVLPDTPNRDAVADAHRDSSVPDSSGELPSDTPAPSSLRDTTTNDPVVTERYPEEEIPVSPEPDTEEERWWLPRGVDTDQHRGTLYLVLDDGGNNADTLAQFLSFPGPLAVAVLPLLPYSVETAVRTSAAGKEVILHLPMEAVGGTNPGPGAILTSMSDRDIIRTLDENIKSVPGVVGVNNHMGSLATQDKRTMEIVLSELRRRDLFFLDSRTSVDTVGREVATALELPFVERQVFLDNQRTREEILTSLHHALELSLAADSVVMIGHVTVSLLAEILKEVYPVLLEAGYRFGAITELLSSQLAPIKGG